MRLSVVIPTFNRRARVSEAIRSVLAQRRAADEIIVVDDGSTDGTSEALRSEFGNQIALVTTENAGVSAARNRGVRASTGDWIAFLDSDDLWLPEKLEVQCRFVQETPECRICQTDEQWWRNGRRVNQGRRHRKRAGWIFAESVALCLISPSAVMLQRELFEQEGGFDEALPACEDYDLWLRITRHTPVALIDAPLVVRYGGHDDQLSRRYWGMDRFRVASLARVLAEGGLGKADRAAAVAVLQEKCAVLAEGARRRGRSDEACRYEQIAAYFASPISADGETSDALRPL